MSSLRGLTSKRRRDTALTAIRLVSGVVFVIFGAGKFVNHASELASFRSYGLPAPAVFVIVIGVVELIGGGLLIANRLVRPAALVLAADMAGAIVVSGIAKGELISLTLAPAEFLAMVLLLVTPSRPAHPRHDRGDAGDPG